MRDLCIHIPCDKGRLARSGRAECIDTAEAQIVVGREVDALLGLRAEAAHIQTLSAALQRNST